MPSSRSPRLLPCLGLLLALSLVALPAVAEERRLYDVELIAFVHPGYVGDEYWPDEPETPTSEQTIGSLTHGASRVGIEILPRPSWRLGPVAYTLRKRGMKTVFHLAWRQAVPERGSASWLRVETSQLRGKIRVTRGRYLHLDADLLLDDPETSRSYRVVTNRRMRSTELHHLDHPKLGILVRADPYEPPAAPPPAAADGAPEPAAADTVVDAVPEANQADDKTENR